MNEILIGLLITLGYTGSGVLTFVSLWHNRLRLAFVGLFSLIIFAVLLTQLFPGDAL